MDGSGLGSSVGQDDTEVLLLGTWCYCSIGRYCVHRALNGTLQFNERHSDGKEVFGILRRAEGHAQESPCMQFQADIFSGADFCGVLRLSVCEDPDTLLSAFRLPGVTEWSTEVCAQRLKGTVSRSLTRPSGSSDVLCFPFKRRCRDAKRVGCFMSWRWVGSTRLVDSAAAHGIYSADVWELQRRSAVFGMPWQAPFLPHDRFWALSRWVGTDYSRHPWTTGTDEAVSLSDTPPLKAPKGWYLDDSKWVVVTTKDSCDGGGWQYAVDFSMPHSHWHGEPSLCSCRRRLWRCTAIKAPEATNGPDTPQHALPLDEGMVIVAREWLPPLQLDVEAERLIANEWTMECLPVGLLHLDDVAEVSVGPWLEDERGGVKVREVSLRIRIVPPSPMAPETSKATLRYRICVHHTHGAPSIAWTASWAMHDIPYGDYFVVLEYISLVPTGDGVVATKAYKVIFLKSTLFQSMIEASSGEGIAASGPRFLDFVRERARLSQADTRLDGFSSLALNPHV